jgi:HEAT repeats
MPGENLKGAAMPIAPSKKLPSKPNLEYLKSQARELLRLSLEQDFTTLERINAFTSSQDLKLADAQFVIAREYGFPNWARLKTYVEALQPTPNASSRKAFVHDLTAQTLEAARVGDLKFLAEKLLLMPLRDILGLRERVVQLGMHAQLVNGLLAGLKSPDDRVRYACAGALDHLADERCAAPLEESLSDPEPRVRRAALHSLSCEACKLVPLTGRGDLIPKLIEIAFNDPNSRVRAAAAVALCDTCNDPRAVAALQKYLPLETNLGRRKFIQKSLARFPHP